MASFAIAPPPHHHPLSSLVPCKFSSKSNPFKFCFSTSISGIGGNINLILAKLSTANHEPCSSTANFITSEQSGSEVRTLSPRDEKSRKESLKELVTSIIKEKTGKRFSEGPNMKGVLRDKNGRSESSSTQESEIVDTSSSLSSRNGDVAVRFLDDSGRSNSSRLGHGKVKKRNSGNCSDDAKDEASVSRRLKKNKIESPEPQVRVALDMCSKKGDFLGAIELYDWARKEGIALGQYHYTLLLYLCSSAAIGVIQPAKSGSGARTLNGLDFSGDDLATDQVKFDKAEDGNELLAIEMQMQSVSGGSMLKGKVGLTSSLSNGRVVHTFKEIKGTGQNPNGFSKPKGHVLDRLNDLRDAKDGAVNQEEQAILLDEKIKEYALERGFEIYKEMCLKEVPMNEATLTSVARMAMSLSDGNMAFNMVKQMKSLGINPRLRSYGPALSAFCNSGDIEKAFEVEKHMLENGVYPEEPELQALLRVSIVAGKGDNVYYLLHKLRASVRRVSPSTADLIEEWFKSKVASRLGKRKWDKGEIKEAVENGGGGWHGKGWLGRGKWTVSRASVGPDGSCRCCGEKLATIDLDPMETENFADSVAAMAIKREKNSSFQKFQKWLDYYGPFEAVIDGANVGLFSQQRFLPAKVNVVVNGIRQKLPSKRWPLIVLHNKRITGNKMDVPVNKAIIEKWKNADALYLTPTGSNDDWYWLYAAIKFKCLIVTNDEMRDHTFQLLGNDFFPKWKERHQVHFSFSDTGPEFHMPPPCSVVIQESENGHWHIPISLEDVYEEDRQWLCIKRVSSRAEISPEGMQPDHQNNEHEMQDSRSEQIIQANHDSTIRQTPEIYKNLRSIFSASVLSRDCTLASELETAERLGRCIIDFQI